jgi:DNA-binding MarR family transcriptional regulator
MSHDTQDRAISPGVRRRRRRKNAFEQLRALLSRKKLRRKIEITEDHIVSILIARRSRETMFGSNLFAEPAWDVLLELYAAMLGTRTMDVSDLATAIGVPRSTTERWVALLEARGFVARKNGTPGQSGSQVSLTEAGQARMKSLADHWGAAFLSI